MSDHPTVTAAAKALLAADGFNDWTGAPQGWKRIHKLRARQAVAAAFRERAGFAETWCVHNPPTVLGHLLCGKCAWLADMLRDWADEIEASRGSA